MSVCGIITSLPVPGNRRDFAVDSLPMVRYFFRVMRKQLRFMDVFCGCGGLTAGLVHAGLAPVIGVESSLHAQATWAANFLAISDPPAWWDGGVLDASFMAGMSGRIRRLGVDVVVGGPPCQGFSLAGLRDPSDPRNSLFREYLRMVEAASPDFVALENVPGFAVKAGRLLAEGLSGLGFDVESAVVTCADFGVPQIRRRFLAIGVRRGRETACNPFVALETARRTIFAVLCPDGARVTAGQAMADLETAGRRLVPCVDPSSPKGFFEAAWEEPTSRNPYLSLMRRGMAFGQGPDSTRLANHGPAVTERFRRIIATCEPGCLSDGDRRRLGIRKHAVVLLGRDKTPSGLTTLPDDMVHYAEPRIPTVREMARLQSFPDSFVLTGPFTTGGGNRVSCRPRCSQIGNAVPPLLGRAIGAAIRIMDGERPEEACGVLS